MDDKQWCSTSEVHHMKKWQNPSGHMDSLSSLCYFNANLWSDANTLVMKTKDLSFPTMPTNISVTGTWGREALLLSSHVRALLRELVWKFIPHGLYVSGTHNIKYHKGIICSFTRQGWKGGEPGLHGCDNLAFRGSPVLP